jgi:hypothetical protein
MVTSTYDLCLLILSTNDSFGVVAIQNNDTLILRDTRFKDLKECELQKAKLLAKPTQKLAVRTNLTFNSYVILLREDGGITL